MKAAKHNTSHNKSEVVATLPPSVSCLLQAEICREQARDAARMKRFRAAFGLFSTAANLCRHVASVAENDENTRFVAAERLQQIDIEMAMYAELARASNFRS
ncbi:hypothetical protein EON80_25840 [bacterium]|nr:MAG: hypothetical protein EON80_25840 [bacterium]